MDIGMEFLIAVVVRSVLAVVIGIIIGSERARRGRAAGRRTHILVALGAALTSMISIYINEILGHQGDILRLSAQVISGVGFLGAGMIVLKNNNTITGLTTAAGVWTTSVIGIAVGCGFYSGAIAVTLLYMLAITILGRFERRKKQSEVVYLEINDMYKANDIILQIAEKSDLHFTYRFVPPKSAHEGHLGVSIYIENATDFNFLDLRKYENVVFVDEE